MKQRLIYWLLNTPCPAYDSIKASVLNGEKSKRWDKLRVGLARWLMAWLDKRRELMELSIEYYKRQIRGE